MLAGDKFITEMHLRQRGLRIVLVIHLFNTNNEENTLKKQEIQDTFIKTNDIELAFTKIWLIVTLRI